MVRPMTFPAAVDVRSAAASPLVPHAPLHAAIANELRRVRERVEALAETLVEDAYFVERYVEHLQAFDMIVQSTEENAAVLERLAQGADLHAAIAPVRLGCVQERLWVAVAGVSPAPVVAAAGGGAA